MKQLQLLRRLPLALPFLLAMSGTGAASRADTPTSRGLAPGTQHGAAARPSSPAPAPPFALPAIKGKQYALKDFQGHPVVLFFYCGCGLCHKCAQQWSTVQRSGALSASAAPTVVVFHGDADEAQSFVANTQLDGKQTVILLDPEGKVGNKYQAEECPRVFIVDAQGKLRYTNNEKGADSYKIAAPLIVARAVDALRALAPKPVKARAARPAKRSQ